MKPLAVSHIGPNPYDGMFKRTDQEPYTPSPKRPSNTTPITTLQQALTPNDFEPTPFTAKRYGLSVDDSNLVREKVDTFGNLVMLVQQMILLYCGRVTKDSEFGKLLAKAAKDIEAYACRTLY